MNYSLTPKTPVTIQARLYAPEGRLPMTDEVEVEITVPAHVALGITEDELAESAEMPPIDSPEWRRRMRQWENPEAWGFWIGSVEASWENPAHDPDTIPFPGMPASEPEVRWSA